MKISDFDRLVNEYKDKMYSFVGYKVKFTHIDKNRIEALIIMTDGSITQFGNDFSEDISKLSEKCFGDVLGNFMHNLRMSTNARLKNIKIINIK